MRATIKSLAIAATLAASSAASAQSSAPSPYWDGPGPWHMWGGWGFWWVFPLSMMIFLIGLWAYLMWRMFGSHGRVQRDDTTRSALRLLNERFAKGDITKEEFEQKRTMLGGRA